MATAGNFGAGDKAGDAGIENAGAGGRAPSSRWKRNLIILAIVALAGWLAWAWHGLREEALVGASYGARVGCVCRFISQRPLASCEGDLTGSGLSGLATHVSLKEDAGHRSVTASVPLLASQTADYRPARGCELEPWRD